MVPDPVKLVAFVEEIAAVDLKRVRLVLQLFVQSYELKLAHFPQLMLIVSEYLVRNYT